MLLENCSPEEAFFIPGEGCSRRLNTLSSGTPSTVLVSGTLIPKEAAGLFQQILRDSHL